MRILKKVGDGYSAKYLQRKVNEALELAAAIAREGIDPVMIAEEILRLRRD
jgi:hypothetical protein